MTGNLKLLIISAAISFLSTVAWAQTESRIITGRVCDEYEQPLPGAAVMIPGTTTGVVTDDRGYYSIKIPADVTTLEFSYMGYVTQKVRLRKRDVVNVELAELLSMLDEVISIGYTTTSKADATGAIQNVFVQDAEMRAVTTTEMLLHGKAAGLELIQDSGQPGNDEMEVRIRGISSIDNNSAPLVIVDGVESSLSMVNSRDILSISILKDASSAAIYGNRAAAGVIVIETKRGTKGINISYSGSVSLHGATSLPDVEKDPIRYIDFVNKTWQIAMGSSTYMKISENERTKWMAQEDSAHQPVDWKPLYYKPGYMQQHHIIASGGGERYDYAISAGFQDQTGVVYSTKANKLDFRAKMNLYFFQKKLQFGANISGNEASSHEAMSASSLINRYITNRPIFFFKTEKSGDVMYGQGAEAYAIESMGGGNDVTNSNLSGTFTLSFQPTQEWLFRATYNLSRSRAHTVSFKPQYEVAGSYELNSRSVRRSELTDKASWGDNSSLSITANWKKKIRRLRFNVLAGYEMRKRGNSWNQSHVYDLMKNTPSLSFGDPNTLSSASSSFQYAAMSGFGRFLLDFDTRYILEGNLRYDGSSRFASGHRFGFFPSLGFAWRVNREPFMKKVNWIDNLKLRVSAGRLGNDNISNYYAYADQMTSSAYYSFGGTLVNGTAYSMFANSNTTWEKVDQINIGIDFDFLKQVRFSVDVFDKEVKDMLSTLYPVISMGTTTNGASQNVGAMRNVGIEVSASWSKLLSNAMWFQIGGNITYIKNTVVSLGPNNEQWHDTSGYVRSVVGEPTRSRYGYMCLGLYQLSDFTWQNNSDPSIPDVDRVYILKPGVTTTSLHQNVRPGDLLLYDKDGDGNITPNDLVRLGRARSDLVFSFNLGWSWKHFDLYALFQGQGNSLAYLQYYAPATSSFMGQVFTDLYDKYWTEETPQYRCLFADKERLGVVSSFDMYNAAYLRLKTMQAGYTFHGAWMDKARIKNLRVYLTGENLLTFSAFPKGFDPERAVNNSTITSYPIIRSVSIGLTLTL